jgi:hypothetical protein
MKLSAFVKILIGFLTAFTVLLPIIAVLFFATIFIPESGLSKGFSSFIDVLPFLLICFPIVQLGLLIFYIYHVIQNKALTGTIRMLFAIGTILLPFIAMPIYFFTNVWKDSAEASLITQIQ